MIEDVVWVLDTSTLLDLKKSVVPANLQWRVFKALEEMVEAGEIALPRQVINETTRIAHPDVPGAWAHGVRESLKYPLDVDFDVMLEVMARVGDVVDQKKQHECADPYLVGLALQLQRGGYKVVVVTSDVVDRLPAKRSLASACAALGLQTMTPVEFVQRSGLL